MIVLIIALAVSIALNVVAVVALHHSALRALAMESIVHMLQAGLIERDESKAP